MNAALRRLALVIFVMLLSLMVAATWIQVVQAPSLNADPRNIRTVYREYGRDRGPIVVEGTSVALSTPVDDAFRFQRTYTNGPLYAPVTGFYSIVFTPTGIESAENAVLNGTADSLFIQRLQDLVTGKQPRGSSVELTLSAAAQQAAWDALGDQRGAVVALDPATGAVLAMVSKPAFDPNVLAAHSSADVNAAYQELLAADGSPLINRALSQRYPPGSTFKLITTAAALESGDYTADTVVPAPDELQLPLSSSVLRNYGGAACSPTGEMTLADALRVSCNTAFAQLGMDLGQDQLRATAESFGFGNAYEVPMRSAVSVFPDDLDAPRTALASIGQESVSATPLQMALIGATIANDGVEMNPYTVSAIRNPDLEIVSETTPSERTRPISADTAEAMTQMMIEVVRSGSGRAAAISGVDVAGKTGTAETTKDVAPHAWFVGFAPAEDPQVVVAVIVENGGDLGNEATGGAVAAPVARAVMEAVLQ
ncbi:MAG: peptidoglycan D,D-transpeptidase FtsI family protein [Cellulomonadaceae bacterium]